jgi:hypothetical protein
MYKVTTSRGRATIVYVEEQQKLHMLRVYLYSFLNPYPANVENMVSS